MIKAPNEREVATFRVTGPQTPLPYAVELWNMARTAPERTLGRAASLGLARAIFTAAQKEHVGRRVVLLRGAEVLQAAG